MSWGGENVEKWQTQQVMCCTACLLLLETMNAPSLLPCLQAGA